MTSTQQRVGKVKGDAPLWKYIKQAFHLWNKNRNRYSWLWCPICDHDLNGDNDSFVKESKDRMYWHYKCANCGCKSRFHLFGPAPIIDSYQRFTEVLLPESL